MATGKRPGPDDLSHLGRLAREPERHHVFQALRIIEAAYPDNPRLGESRRPREDKVRLGQEAELAFPPSTIASFTPPEGKKPARLINRFFGLFGPQGPLPLQMTEYVRDRYRNHRDRTIVAFVAHLDVIGKMVAVFNTFKAVLQVAFRWIAKLTGINAVVKKVQTLLKKVVKEMKKDVKEVTRMVKDVARLKAA